ncbi:zinc-binding dehydrogenase [Actinomadura sp. 3N407]|uniref:zinc-binding dehydrogenase n=1 Tax=Actinomadura sp. 3N407 TaxID=3457423 RepID=UPI003FCD14EA
MGQDEQSLAACGQAPPPVRSESPPSASPTTTFDLTEIVDAHRRLESNAHIGKVIVEVRH